MLKCFYDQFLFKTKKNNLFLKINFYLKPKEKEKKRQKCKYSASNTD